MESLGFGPIETDDDPYWTDGFGPIHAHPNLWPDDMPELRRGGHRLLARHGGARRAGSRASSRLRSTSTRRSSSAAATRHVTNMRINYYPAQERPPEPEQLRAGAHSDYGAFTILKGESAPAAFRCCAAAATGPMCR